MKGNKVSYYEIKQPNGRKYRLYYNKESGLSEKVESLENSVLGYWKDNIEDNWLSKSSKKGFYYDSEDKVKYLLDNCANFLLQGELYKKKLWIGRKKQKKINHVESPIEYAGTHVENVFYSSNKQNCDFRCGTSLDVEDYEKYVLPVIKSGNNKRVRKWKIESSIRHKKISDIGLLVDFNRPYISNWSLVDVDNHFKFNNKKFVIDEAIEAYRGVFNKKENALYYEQDKVLCYYQDSNYFFYDMSYNHITKGIIESESTLHIDINEKGGC